MGLLQKHLAASVLLHIDVWAMKDPIDSSMQARLAQLARDEREIATSLRGQSQFLVPVAGQLPTLAQSPVVDMLAQQQQLTASLAQAAQEPSKKTTKGSETCSPACKAGQGICVNGLCLCQFPWSGESCEVAEATDDEVPFERDARKLSPDVGEALKQKVAMPLAIFIWSMLLVVTFLCTALCPQLCGRRSGGPDETDDYSYTHFEKTETQFDIIEAWTFDNRKRYEREGQNDSQRRRWFEEIVGPKLHEGKWPRVKR